jgi:hypothetical protein
MASREKEAEWLLQADFCRKMADSASSVEKKVAWLNLASKWLALASNVRVVGEDSPFDTVVQDDSRRKEPISSR